MAGPKRSNSKAGQPSRQPVKKKSRAERKKRAGPQANLAFVGAWIGAIAAGALWFFWEAHKKAGRDAETLKALAGVPLDITEHALCRMRCRHVSEKQVREVLRTGHINDRKSNRSLVPCQKLVVDGRLGKSRKNVEVVVSACPTHTSLVTVIDKDTDWICVPECP